MERAISRRNRAGSGLSAYRVIQTENRHSANDPFQSLPRRTRMLESGRDY